MAFSDTNVLAVTTIKSYIYNLGDSFFVPVLGIIEELQINFKTKFVQIKIAKKLFSQNSS